MSIEFAYDDILNWVSIVSGNGLVPTRYSMSYRCALVFMLEQQIYHGPLIKYVELRVRMRRECRESFPRHRG